MIMYHKHTDLQETITKEYQENTFEKSTKCVYLTAHKVRRV